MAGDDMNEVITNSTVDEPRRFFVSVCSRYQSAAKTPAVPTAASSTSATAMRIRFFTGREERGGGVPPSGRRAPLIG